MTRAAVLRPPAGRLCVEDVTLPELGPRDARVRVLVALAQAGRIDIGAALSRCYPLGHVNQALDALRGGEVIRAVLS